MLDPCPAFGPIIRLPKGSDGMGSLSISKPRPPLRQLFPFVSLYLIIAH